MYSLSPKLAAQTAQFAYESRTAKNGINADDVPPILAHDFDFSGNLIQGVSGTLLERLFNHKTGFGVIGRGRPNSPYSNHHIVAIRGTASGRDAVTDLHCGVTNGPNNKRIHAGFNHNFRSMKSNLTSYFSAPGIKLGPVHCVGHSLGGALANLTANWLRANYHVPVSVYTFGAPRVGRKDYANSTQGEMENIYRCVHGADPVPMVPVWPFVHAGADYRLDGARGINPAAHKMDGYIENAGRFNDYTQMHIDSVGKQLTPVRLKYSDRHQVSFSVYWQERISNALITLLKDAGFYTAVVAQAAIGTTLTIYDVIAQKLEDIARMSPVYAEQELGLLGCMLTFAGNKKAVKAADLTYTFIRWVLRLTLERLFKSAKSAIQIASAVPA
ncbi:lipase family protein [Corallincola holothuriorum]|uniref:Lipase family protein n=1 Tax=Corallincola holothuriorum TaxID=2282215 RepID=A0A368NR80_9GAMM|nr:lipase family protein [Corallincola holothuriorum]RCU52908.1 lipase family protein [Corallincola holothuriorum]